MNNKKRKSLIDNLDKFLIPRELSNDFFWKNIYHFLSIFFITIVYILNTHLYDKHNNFLNKLREREDSLKVEYNLIKAEYICYTQKSQIAKMLEDKKIIIPKTPPFVIHKKL